MEAKWKKDASVSVAVLPSPLYWDPRISNTGLFNCLFRTCATCSTASNGGGGALYFQLCSSVRLDYLSFRDCYSKTGNGQDLYINTTPHPTVLTTVSNCDSTSTPKTSRIFPTTITVDDVLPDPSETITLLSLTHQERTSLTEDIIVTLDKTVTGTLLVLVSNSEGTTRTEKGKAPNIGRVLLFPIESSKIGECTASIGDTGLLQLPLEEYKIVTASLSKHTVSFSGVSPGLVNQPTLTSADCILDESHTRALLILEGSDLDDATFELTLQDGWTLEATFSENKSTIDLGVIGVNSRWQENQMFVIMSGKKVDESIVVSIPLPLYFIIPKAARLTNIEVRDLNEAMTEVTLSFSSRLLKANQEYEITIEPKNGSEEVVVKLTTDNNGLIAEQTVKLYPSDENVEGWKNSIGFGEEYEVVGVSAKAEDGDYPIQFSPIILTMPIEPVRVKKAECSTDQPTTTIVRIEGSGLIEYETYTLTLRGTPTTDPLSLNVQNTTISVVALLPTEAKSTPLPLSSTSESSLLFGHTYTITAITNGSVTGIVENNPYFTGQTIVHQQFQL
ncbi:hypothetical protein BLNAU_20757 [Blattamonas nauphoetae]|uniref:Uncharacterized protein n=1 Tax=Blattamonas nauphoetae TaxID=2049346 RepID=A0ABQ9WXS1_9EUKA|nr:hypothetical protein BLNAU_20757 [Blattamonas nauphoetae]